MSDYEMRMYVLQLLNQGQSVVKQEFDRSLGAAMQSQKSDLKALAAVVAFHETIEMTCQTLGPHPLLRLTVCALR